VIGDTVNTAARMEGLTRSVGARVLVSDAIVRVLGDRLVLGKRAELPVKGKAAAIVVHELLGLKDA
jgi:adenylate cyclase